MSSGICHGCWIVAEALYPGRGQECLAIIQGTCACCGVHQTLNDRAARLAYFSMSGAEFRRLKAAGDDVLALCKTDEQREAFRGMVARQGTDHGPYEPVSVDYIGNAPCSAPGWNGKIKL